MDKPRGRGAAAWHLALHASFGLWTRGHGFNEGAESWIVSCRPDSEWLGINSMAHLRTSWMLLVEGHGVDRWSGRDFCTAGQCAQEQPLGPGKASQLPRPQQSPHTDYKHARWRQHFGLSLL